MNLEEDDKSIEIHIKLTRGEAEDVLQALQYYNYSDVVVELILLLKEKLA